MHYQTGMAQTELSTDKTPPKDTFPVIGLMSGTSADGIDGCVILTDGQHVTPTGLSLCQPYRPEVATAVLAARDDPAGYLSDPHRRQALITAITEDHTQIVHQLIKTAEMVDMPQFSWLVFTARPSITTRRRGAPFSWETASRWPGKQACL